MKKLFTIMVLCLVFMLAGCSTGFVPDITEEENAAPVKSMSFVSITRSVLSPSLFQNQHPGQVRFIWLLIIR